MTRERPEGYYCGATSTACTPCRLRAGWGTIHLGRGRCRLHGGITRVDDGRLKRGGRYSEVLPAQLREKYQSFLEEAEAIEDVSSEIALKRSLLATYLSPALERLTEEALGDGEFPLGDVAALLDWASEIEKGAMRLARIENLGALTQAEVSLVEMAVVDVLCRYIEDEDKRLKAVNELAWRLGRVRQEKREQALLEGGNDG